MADDMTTPPADDTQADGGMQTQPLTPPADAPAEEAPAAPAEEAPAAPEATPPAE